MSGRSCPRRLPGLRRFFLHGGNFYAIRALRRFEGRFQIQGADPIRRSGLFPKQQTEK